MCRPSRPWRTRELNAGDSRRQPRERFAETAYWNPLVVTGKDGKARVTFKAPTALSAYRITARGRHRGRHAGRPDDLVADGPQELLRRPQASESLTQGDKPRFIARVHHTDLVGKLALRLNIYAGGRDEVFPRTSTSSRTASTRSCSSRSRFPRPTRFA